MSGLELAGLEWDSNHGQYNNSLIPSQHIGQELAESTLAETGILAGESTEPFVEVPAKTVVDTRSPCPQGACVSRRVEQGSSQ